jgi:hypothetical protein
MFTEPLLKNGYLYVTISSDWNCTFSAIQLPHSHCYIYLWLIVEEARNPDIASNGGLTGE